MTVELSLHSVAKVAAESGHGGDAHWVELTFHFERDKRGQRPTPFTLNTFFEEALAADQFAAAVNCFNARPYVARNDAELLQQLRDSVALCDAQNAQKKADAEFYNRKADAEFYESDFGVVKDVPNRFAGTP